VEFGALGPFAVAASDLWTFLGKADRQSFGRHCSKLLLTKLFRPLCWTHFGSLSKRKRRAWITWRRLPKFRRIWFGSYRHNGVLNVYVHKEREREGFGLTYKGFNLCSSYVNGLYLESSNFTLKKTAVNQFKPLEQQKKIRNRTYWPKTCKHLRYFVDETLIPIPKMQIQSRGKKRNGHGTQEHMSL